MICYESYEQVDETLLKTLAKVHERGVGELHLNTGDMLIDPSGNPWLFDFNHAIYSKKQTSEVISNDQAHLTAAINLYMEQPNEGYIWER